MGASFARTRRNTTVRHFGHETAKADGGRAQIPRSQEIHIRERSPDPYDVHARRAFREPGTSRAKKTAVKVAAIGGASALAGVAGYRVTSGRFPWDAPAGGDPSHSGDNGPSGGTDVPKDRPKSPGVPTGGDPVALGSLPLIGPAIGFVAGLLIGLGIDPETALQLATLIVLALFAAGAYVVYRAVR